MSEGDTFGEVALLQSSTRTATVVCKTTCEFLKIDRDDFNQVWAYMICTVYFNRYIDANVFMLISVKFR